MTNPSDVDVSIDLSAMIVTEGLDPSGSGNSVCTGIIVTPGEVDPGKKGNFKINFAVTSGPPNSTVCTVTDFRFKQQDTTVWNSPKNDPNTQPSGVTENDEFQWQQTSPLQIKDKNDNSSVTTYEYILVFNASGEGYTLPATFVNDPTIKNW